MIYFFKKSIVLIVLLLSLIFSFQHSLAASSNQYIKLHPSSSSYDVKKFQQFFKALKIYKWNIDGKYKNIKPYIISFQVKNKIIASEKSDWAWYIWPKTYALLEKKYWKKFKEAYDKFFKLNSPKVWKQQYFIVSAYYSPLPWQKRYYNWSYARDIAVNWKGTHWASWSPVHPWFIAAPSHYKFGTKIELEWLWIGTVEDRWWAIVRRWVKWHEYDRLDIWMWYWDAWLEKALQWWVRTVKWKILPQTAKNTITAVWERNDTRKHLAKEIWPDSGPEKIEKMQLLFIKAKLYTWKINGKYKSFEPAILDFQLKNRLITNKSNYWAWYIWKKTISKLEKKYPQIFLESKKEKKKSDKVQEIVVEKKQAPKKSEKKKPDKIIKKKILTEDEKILKKYNISKKSKDEIESLNNKIQIFLTKKIWKDNIKLKTVKNKIKKKIWIIRIKTQKQELKNSLLYLQDIL